MDSLHGNTHDLNKSIAPKKKPLNDGWRLFATGFSFTIFGLGALLCGSLFLLASLLPFNPSAKQRWFRHLMSTGCKAYLNMLRKLGVLTYSMTPKSTIADSGKIVVANHPTLLDAVFIVSMVPNLCCITKKALWTNPLTASVVRMAGYIRNDAVDFTELANSKLNNGENLLIFPEGTRNSRDDQLDFKRGAANLAILCHADIIPIIIHCQPRTLQKNEKWHQIPPQRPHFTITTLSILKTKKYALSSQDPRTIQYRKLTQALRSIYVDWLAQKKTQLKDRS